MRPFLRVLVPLVAHVVPSVTRTSELLFLSSYRRFLTLAWRFLIWFRSIATGQNDRYLVLTCRRVFAKILLVFLGFFYDGSSCLGRRITLLPEARASKRLFMCVREPSLRLYGNGDHRNLTPGSSI
jgi:hypothetical protein